MADEDRAVMERLAALEAEVKADADAAHARKAAALAKLREQRVTKAAVARPAVVKVEPVKLARVHDDEPSEDLEELDDHSARKQSRIDDLNGAIELASKANRVKNELSRPRKQGDKSWVKSAAASFALGPVGWLYAGSMREAVPASAAWLVVAGALYKFLPFFFLPVMMVVLPLSAIAGVVYALQYNRSGGRQRLFDGNGDKAKPKQLREG
ncbi:MAG TPA: hypothetical protein VFP84_04955 [Kofleriaceae bacterium]|nr:hypothetical protein [Kofleriaceae bacterium]